MLTTLLLLLVVGGGILLWKAKMPDGTFNWKRGTSGLAAIGVAVLEFLTHFISGFVS